MNAALVRQIADAVLYEGYLLYPYRMSSVKNRQRWTFGGVYPRAYAESSGGADAWSVQTECLVRGDQRTSLQIQIRFLHLLDRRVGQHVAEESAFHPVAELRIGEQVVRPHQEAVEREVFSPKLALSDLAQPVRTRFAFPARCDFQPLSGPDGETGGAIERRQWAVEGEVEWSAPRIAEGLFKLTVRILNCTPYARADGGDRDEALMRALVSTHAILGVQEGEFISLLDPPESCREAAAGCRNVGLWPVLVGEEGATDALLASPIILYDYPQIAPESPGDLFDGTEIDEILTLRILTLTDAEKREMIAGDERARALLARTEAMGPEELMRLHGTMRGLRPLSEGESRE